MKTNVLQVQSGSFNRREFLAGTMAAALSAYATGLDAAPKPSVNPTKKGASETAVKALYDSLSVAQSQEMCFDWNHVDPKRGLLRGYVTNNWRITPHRLTGDFYTNQQKDLIHNIFRGLIHPDWYARFLKQNHDDNQGLPWGTTQGLAIFGTPGSDQFECVITGRHMTLRADGNTTDHVAFGGPIFYGHTIGEEPADHKGNIFWQQGLAANTVCEMLDGKQRKQALIADLPVESSVEFLGRNAVYPGIPVTELTTDQKGELQKVLQTLVAPFRTEDQDEVRKCLKKQGGLDKCSLAFYTGDDIGNDGVWDSWRLEGPSFVWYFRGTPHIHVWVNVADDPSVTYRPKV
jgi:ribosomal protein S18